MAITGWAGAGSGNERGGLKLTGFPKGEPDSLYRRDSPWISSYHIHNPFQSNITDISHIYNITWVYLLHNPKDCVTKLRVPAPWAKRKVPAPWAKRKQTDI